MKVILKGIAQADWKAAIDAAIAADKSYREIIGPRKPIILGKKFVVHETATGTIVVQYKKGF
jgi:hypothetical protein